MDKTTLAALALLLLTPFGAFADPTVPGIPDVDCQTPAEWRVHDYVGSDDVDFLHAPLVAVDGNVAGCPGGGWDGDAEFAAGGAILYARTGDGATGGSLACHGGVGHHPEGGQITVTDASGYASFAVFADASSPLAPPLPGEPDCGDGILQPCPGYPHRGHGPPNVWWIVDTFYYNWDKLWNMDGSTCNSADRAKECDWQAPCFADFAPGADGSYLVFVSVYAIDWQGLPAPATAGHVHL